MDCKHFNFKVAAKVGRLHEEGNPDKITGYMLDIVVCCIDCGLPFEFIGVPGGYSPAQPMVNFDATQLRAPIKPSSDPVEHFNVIAKNKMK